jgi:uncharacterized repeat protein (TIGR02543 family)
LKNKIVPIAIVTLILFCGAIFQASTVNAQYPNRFRLTITTNNYNGGYTTPSGYVDIDSGLSYQVMAVARPGYVFSGWYLNGVYQNKLTTITITMLRDNTLTATFSQQANSLEISVNPPEAGITNPAAGTLYYQYGNSVQVNVQPSSGYIFTGWYLDGAYAGLDTSINVQINGDRKLSAYFGDATPAPSPSPTPRPTSPTPTTTPTPTPTPVQLPQGDLTVSCQSSSTYDGFNVNINGLLTAGGTSVPNAGILLYVSVTDGSSWDVLSFVNTDSNGVFSVSWKPSVTGNYVLKAVWNGNMNYSSTAEIFNFAITPFEQQSVFSVTSNSTLSGLSFDSETKDLIFSTNGTSGSTGYVNIVIPKSLVADISSVRVFVDGNQLTYNSGSKSDSWEISFTYHQSTHDLRIGLDEAPVQSKGLSIDTTTLIIGVLAAAIIALVIVVTILAKKKSPRIDQ